MKDDAIWTLVFWASVIFAVAIFALGHRNGAKSQREDAVKAGVAYYTNNAAGESIFVWRECK